MRMTNRGDVVGVCCLLTAVLCGTACADEGVEFFEQKIRPVLADRCYSCHSADAASKKTLKGGLLLDTREATRKGGESGPAVVPGKPEDSLLIAAIRHESIRMPPKGKLPDDAIADFVKWVKIGAPDPRDGRAPAGSAIGIEAARRSWAYQTPKLSRRPEVADTDWPQGVIDRLVLATLDANGLRPASPADKRTLIRRAAYDLLGLPTTTDEIEAFLADDGPDAFAHAVDRMLESPDFGIRWARHWLDNVRYAQDDPTCAANNNGTFSIGPYRDWVVKSFNEDLPYDQFVRLQVAGDLIPLDDPELINTDGLTATGIWGLAHLVEGNDKEKIVADFVDEQLDVLGRTFLGLTVSCARCHDHKFDPIPASDYYALAGIMGSTQTARPIGTSKNFTWNTVADPREDPDGSRLAEYETRAAEVSGLSKRISKLRRTVAATRTSGVLPADEKADSLAEWIAAKESDIAAMQTELTTNRKSLPAKPATFMGTSDAAPSDVRLRIRGNPHRMAEAVPRGLLQVVSRTLPTAAERYSISDEQSGRLQLAEWLTDKRNPLTARVFVNRVWHHLFGKGLVSTPDNFGTTGELPSHPELLDWLARQFMDDDWSVKRLVRRIVLSRTYQLSTARQDEDEVLLSHDPDNRLCGRRTPRSIDAETLRDMILAAAGELDLQPGGKPFNDGLRKEHAHVFQSKRRSVYVPRFRNHQLDLFRLFDGANPAQVVGQRDETILPTQAMFLENNSFVVEHARIAARRLLTETRWTSDERIQQMYLRTLARFSTDEETAIASAFVDDENSSDEQQRLDAWSALQHALFKSVDFRYVK
jgi:hypothetical protein